MPKVLAATAFKAQCLAILKQVAKTGEAVSISKRGKVVATIVPPQPPSRRFPQAALRHQGETVGDIVSPASTVDDWEALGRDD